MIKEPTHWSVKRYPFFLLGGIVFSAVAIFIYNYKYLLSEDDLLGLIAACSLFIGGTLVGQGIRGWNEMTEFKDQFFHVSGRGGMDMTVRKRGK
jgi:H+/Cl- antiporter ClcA